MSLTRFLRLAALLLAGSAPLSAQTASPVMDVAAREHGLSGSPFGQLAAVQDKVFFRLTTSGSAGHQLWVTDGTAEGTRSLMDACYGDCSTSVELLGGLGPVLFFSVSGFLNGQLWRSDGTPEGTFLLTRGLQVALDLSAKDRGWTFFRGALYFGGCAAGTGCGLWKSDGTVEGTVRLKDLGESRSAWNLRAAGDRLFFSASNLAGDSSFWSSDGTAAGTAELKPFGKGNVAWIGASDGKVFLSLHDQEAQTYELWASDGTAAGTRLVRSFQQIFDMSVSTGGRAWFLANDGIYDVEVWISDGTANGTLRVSGFGPFFPSFSTLVLAGNRVVYTADDGLHGPRVWSTATTVESTVALPLPCQGCHGGTQLVPLGGRVLLFLYDEAHGWEPWITDGTAAGSHLVADVCPGSCSSVAPGVPVHPTAQGLLFTTAEDSALWRTDGTAAGTVRLASAPPDSRIVTDTGGYPRVEAGALGSRVYFGVVGDGLGRSLWVSEGVDGARLLTVPSPFGPSSWPGELAALGDRLLFMASDGGANRLYATRGTPETTQPIGLDTDGVFRDPDWEAETAGNLVFHRRETSRDDGSLWRTDGTAAGTFWLGVFASPGIAESQGRLYFPYLSSTTANLQIWQSDGSKAGTVKALDIPRASGWQELRNLTGLGPELYFTVDDDLRDLDQQVWRSDGTPAGTRKLVDVSSYSFPLPRPQFVRAGSSVFFAGGGGELWKTDGTAGGTIRLLGETPDGGPLLATELTAFQGAVYFSARTSGTRRALWRSDGTPAGTVPLVEFKDFESGEFPFSGITAAAGRLWFSAGDDVHGVELWTSDGTAAGTVQVKDIHPGFEHSFPSGLLFAGGRLFFSAGDGGHGVELWESDGTEAGTRMVQDIAPFASSSFPADLTVAGDRLYFSATDGALGRELWSLPFGGPACQPGDFTLCLSGGRFRVEARWRDFQGNAGAARAVSLNGGDTGYFWFFDPANVELILKVLDGQGLNEHHWVFYGALSNVEYVITVTDTRTGLTRQYVNPPGRLASVGDTQGFGPRGAHSVSTPSPPALRRTGFSALAVCEPSPERLCLRGGRFAVEATWKDFQGNTGRGTAVSLTGDTGYFWFFDAANVEVVLKVLDGTGLNGKHWVFYGALSNVEYTITVTDTLTGQSNTYENPSGRFASVADTGAF